MNLTLAALADPTRRAILARLKTGPASVAELAKPFRMSQQAVSKHLAFLRRAQLIRKRREGRQQICELAPEPLGEVAVWVEDYRGQWESAFGRLHELLERPADEVQPKEE